MVSGGIAGVLTAVFGLASAFYLVETVVAALAGGASLAVAVDNGLHVLMGAGMIAMVWPWGAHVPAAAYVVVFTAAALWFAAGAVARTAASCDTHAGHRGTRSLWYHAAMMASMVWMAVATAVMAGPAASARTLAEGTVSGMSGMAGMSGTAPIPPSGTSMAAGAMPRWVTLPCVVLAAGFFAVAALYLAGAFRVAVPAAGRRPAAGVALGFLMALGMGVAFAAMS